MFDTLSSAARFPPMYSNPPTYATPTLEHIGMVAESDNIYAQFYAAPTPEYIGMVAESDNYAQVYAAPTPEHIGTVAESDFDISDFYAQTYTTPTREHIGMVAGSDFDFSNFTPHDDAADCHSPCFSNLNLFTSEGVPLSQNILYPPLPTVLPPWLIDENFPTSSLMLDMPFVQAAEQSALLFPPAVPGASSIQPQITSVPPDDDARWSYRYQDFSETGLTPTGDQHSSVQLIPPSPPAPSTPPSLIKIPQRDYDYGRKQKSFKPLEPIIFSTNNSPGMNLGDALHKDFKGLDGRDEPMLQGTRGAISCRLLFPGYPDNGSSCQIHSKNWTSDRMPINRCKLAFEVAKKLDQYLKRMAIVAPGEAAEDRWKIGKGFMKIENMLLVSLVSVSTGSFQPEIWVADPSVSYHYAEQE